MEETGIPKANSYIKKGNSVVILMGVNDVNYNGKEKTYVTTINKHANAWDKKGVKTYFVSVNPVGSKYTTMNYKKMNENINSFNKYLKKHLNSKVKYIDTNSGMTSKECDSHDGLHYSDSVYKSLYNKIKKQIK